jgi:hypothetical protein
VYGLHSRGGVQDNEGREGEDEHAEYEVEQLAREKTRGVGPQDRPWHGSCRKEQPGTVIDASHPGIGNSTRGCVEKHHGERDAGNSVGGVLRVEHQECRDEEDPPAGADERTVGANGAAQQREQRIDLPPR